MEEIELKDWFGVLGTQLDGLYWTKEGMLQGIHLCEETLAEIVSAYAFILDQKLRMEGLLKSYRALYKTMHGSEAPRFTREGLESEEVLDSPESRVEEVRMVALELAEHPGQEVTDQAVLDALLVKGKKFIATNPRATVSTILYGFKTDFVKVKRSTFKRLELV